MKSFKEFFTEATEAERDIRNTLKKVPKSHRNLVRGYKFKWQSGNTLKGDDEHIGIINPHTKTITIAAPYNYPREFTFLHELGHKIFEKWMTPELREEWIKILKNTKHKMHQNNEELWCMAYANHFAKNKITIHDHPEWEKFMKKFLKMTL